jgi:hypothetical protein
MTTMRGLIRRSFEVQIDQELLITINDRLWRNNGGNLVFRLIRQIKIDLIGT